MIRYYIAVRDIRACEIVVRDLCAGYRDDTPLNLEQKHELTKAMEELGKLREGSKGRGEERGGWNKDVATTERAQHFQKKGKLKEEQRKSVLPGDEINSVT